MYSKVFTPVSLIVTNLTYNWPPAHHPVTNYSMTRQHDDSPIQWFNTLWLTTIWLANTMTHYYMTRQHNDSPT